MLKNNAGLFKQPNHEVRPWGKFEVLLDSKECKVKRLFVDPFKSLSYQYHLKRSEHWTIVSGNAEIILDGEKKIYGVGQSIEITSGVYHSVKNNSPQLLIIIEVQYGSYFGEDDIIRISDPYKR